MTVHKSQTIGVFTTLFDLIIDFSYEWNHFMFVGCDTDGPERVYFDFKEFHKNNETHSYMTVFDKRTGCVIKQFKNVEGVWKHFYIDIYKRDRI
jgi:hypothetical protein